MSLSRTPPFQPASDPLPFDRDTFCHLMRVSRRRYAVRYLASLHPETTVTVYDLAEIIAADERECARAELTSQVRNTVYIPLIQRHLPTLDEHGLVEYDDDRKTVSPGPACRSAAAALRVLDSFFE